MSKEIMIDDDEISVEELERRIRACNDPELIHQILEFLIQDAENRAKEGQTA